VLLLMVWSFPKVPVERLGSFVSLTPILFISEALIGEYLDEVPPLITPDTFCADTRRLCLEGGLLEKD